MLKLGRIPIFSSNHGVSNNLFSESPRLVNMLSKTPLPKFGIEIRGIDLQDHVTEDVVHEIKQDVEKHRIVVFRDQGVIPGQRQVDISRWFGTPESTFYKHPQSPDPDVFRVSNDRAHGCTGVGRTGMHVDGSFQEAPFSIAVYHIVACPTRGDTVFLPLTEFLHSVPREQYERWDRLWMLSDRRCVSQAKPLVYHHPKTKQPTMCFHLGMTAAFVWDYGTRDERVTGTKETASILQEIEDAISEHSDLIYAHKWRQGDFIISDNAALAHEASSETQLPPSVVGLRIMHRTTIGGTIPPRKIC